MVNEIKFNRLHFKKSSFQNYPYWVNKRSNVLLIKKKKEIQCISQSILLFLPLNFPEWNTKNSVTPIV